MTALREIYRGVVWGIFLGLALAVLLIWLSGCAPVMLGYSAAEGAYGIVRALTDDAKTPPHP